MFNEPKLAEWKSKRKLQWVFAEDSDYINSLEGVSFADKLHKFLKEKK